jgi:hypothetical protein
MDREEFQEKMKSLIGGEGLGKPKALKIETPWEKQQWRHRPARHSRLGRALGYMFLVPILLVGIVIGAVVGGIMMYWALDSLQRFHG